MRKLDLIGQQFGHLKVLSLTKKWDKRAWLCECSCGNQRILPTSCLTKGLSVSCGCARGGKWGEVKDWSYDAASLPIVGERKCSKCKDVKLLVDFTINHELPNGSRRKEYWRYTNICKVCESVRASDKFQRNRTPLRYNDSICKARAKGNKFELTREQYFNLVASLCEYCGCELNIKRGIGLDRKDSKLHYTIDNVVPCCRPCNIAKSDSFTYEEMKIIGMAIRKVKIQRMLEETNKKEYTSINDTIIEY